MKSRGIHQTAQTTEIKCLYALLVMSVAPEEKVRQATCSQSTKQNRWHFSMRTVKQLTSESSRFHLSLYFEFDCACAANWNMWSVVFYTLPSFVPILRHLLLLKGYNPESCSHNPENHICTKSNAYVCGPYFTIRITANYTAHEGRDDNKRYLKIYIVKLLLEKRFELGSFMKFSKTIY